MKNLKFTAQNKNNPDVLDIRSIILTVSFDLVCGLLLILLGNLALRVTSYVLSGVLILTAVWEIVTYIRSSPLERITQSKLAIGLALILSGVLLSFNPDYLNSFLPFIWGLALLFGAFLKFQSAFDQKTVKIEKWWLMLVFSAFSLILGILCLLNPAFLGDKRELIIGIMLILEAVLDIVVFMLLNKALKKMSAATLPLEVSAADAQNPVAENEPVPAAEPLPNETDSADAAAPSGET